MGGAGVEVAGGWIGLGGATVEVVGRADEIGTGVERICCWAADAAEKMLVKAAAALAAVAGFGAGWPLGLSRCLTRVIRSCG